MPYWSVCCGVAFLDRDDVAAGLVVDLDHLRQAAGLGLHDHVGQKHGEGLVADDLARAPDGVAEAERLCWRVKLDWPGGGRSRRELLDRLRLAALAERRLRARSGCRNGPR